jgi:spore coat protein CotF
MKDRDFLKILKLGVEEYYGAAIGHMQEPELSQHKDDLLTEKKEVLKKLKALKVDNMFNP